ncbi:MAG: glycine cleavage system protein H [bacterium]|nr:glycine cleavage system protein H [bacterium]
MNRVKKTAAGMRIIPPGERKCIWMDAGVVSYKLCTNQFQCNICEFDLAMSNRAAKSKMEAQENRAVPGHKKEIAEWMEEFKHLPADQRKCRYMLSGDVAHKICPNSFRCGDCTFDQMMQDRVQPRLERDAGTFTKIAGFNLNENFYYFRNHTWLRLERNGKYRIGIDDFARRLIGKTSGVALPPLGRNLEMEEYSWTINHDYHDLEFFSPLDGVVDSVNYGLLENTRLLTDEPYGDGWLMTVEPKNIGKSNRNFLKGEEARSWMVEEANLLSKSISSHAGVTMHDGASLVEDISGHLDREKWLEIVKNRLYVK